MAYENGKKDFGKRDNFRSDRERKTFRDNDERPKKSFRDKSDDNDKDEGFRQEPRTDLVIGRNAVKEALKAGRPADSLLV